MGIESKNVVLVKKDALDGEATKTLQRQTKPKQKATTLLFISIS